MKETKSTEYDLLSVSNSALTMECIKLHITVISWVKYISWVKLSESFD